MSWPVSETVCGSASDATAVVLIPTAAITFGAIRTLLGSSSCCSSSAWLRASSAAVGFGGTFSLGAGTGEWLQPSESASAMAILFIDAPRFRGRRWRA